MSQAGKGPLYGKYSWIVLTEKNCTVKAFPVQFHLSEKIVY